jgi:muramoyltetrapeptide carboxypeptidase
MALRMETRKRIAVVAPACPIGQETAARVMAAAQNAFGANAPDISFHPQCFLSEGHFAGSDELRCGALVDAANDPKIDAIWFARGGYGSGRIADAALNRLGPAARAKIYFGYSDLGFLLGRFYASGIGRPVHGPMPQDIVRPGGEGAVLRALRYLADGDHTGIEPSATGSAPAVAFNITILAHLLASGKAPDLRGHVVLLEEVSEHHYRIDRALGAITANVNIRQAAGIRLGRCSDIPPNDPDFGKSEEEIARFWCARSGIPYLGRADIGHDAENKLVPFGGRVSAA